MTSAMMAPFGRPRENRGHYYCESEDEHFWDAGNYVYTRALQGALLYCSPLALNGKTLGDLVECILALAARRRPTCHCCLRRTELMEDMARPTVELERDLPWVAFDGGSAQWAFDVDELRIKYCRAGWE